MKKYLILIATVLLPFILNAQDIEARLNKWRDPKSQGIAGVTFGSSYETTKTAFVNKWGDPADADRNNLYFSNVNYGNKYFDVVILEFQRDTKGKSYFSRCIFVKNEKTKQDAIDRVKSFSDMLAKTYGFIYNNGSDNDEDLYYFGGLNPLGKEDEYLFTIDRLEFDDGTFAARIDYGPFDYVKEEF